MSEDPSGAAPQITDWTSGSTNGTAGGGMTGGDLVAGNCGDALDFDGTNDYIELGDVLIDGTDEITLEAWVNPGSIRTNGSPSGHNANEGGIIHKNGGSDDNLGLTVSSGGVAYYIDENSNNTIVAGSVTAGTWTHLVGTWNGTTMNLYQDGVFIGTQAGVNGSFVNNTNSLRIGGEHVGAGNPFWFDGLIDEVRISDIARSADWIATQYAAQNSPEGIFYLIGAEQPLTYTAPIANEKVGQLQHGI